MATRTLTYREALEEGWAFAPATSSARKKYQDILGGGDRNVGKAIYAGQQFKDEQFWKDTFSQFQGVADTKSLKKAQSLLQSAKEKTGREVGRTAAASKRLARATGGLLSGAGLAPMGNGDGGASGPMLGADSSLGGGSMLGGRTRI